MALLTLSGNCSVEAQKPELKIPSPEQEILETKDGVALYCTFYPGGFVQESDGKVGEIDGKETPAVILLHGHEGDRNEHSALAAYLQKKGNAVIVPDLRGHGRSVTQKLPGREDRTLELDRFGKNEFASMMWDVIAVKKFLMEKNNRGELNIEQLAVVGSDLGAIVALQWINYDWSLTSLPTIKQGHDVKVFVLVSPPQTFKGYSALPYLRHPALAKHLEGAVIVGKRDSKNYTSAVRIHQALVKGRTDEEKKFVFLRTPDTSLGGSRLLLARTANEAPEGEFVEKLISVRLGKRAADFPWQDRASPLD